MISHFDSDHCGKVVEIMEGLWVKNIIISKQAEDSKEFTDIVQKAKKKRINTIVVQAGDKILIDKDTYFQIIWPFNSNIKEENGANNNSIVAKFYYRSFTILFTGDIEESSEKALVNMYGDELFSNVLKIAHHGSKTSSIKEFIEKVRPQITLIGVGVNNKFGHPNSEVLKRLENLRK